MQKEWTTNKVMATIAAVFCCHLLPRNKAIELLQDVQLTTVFDNSKSCNDLYWLHPPKTSSTFCTTISHICCSSQFDFGVTSLKQNEPYRSRLQYACSLPANLRQQGLACIGKLYSVTIPSCNISYKIHSVTNDSYLIS